MIESAQFPSKLALALKALSLSRGRLAADLGVDKSLVGRWVSGTVTPSEHNLSNLTRLIAEKRTGFNMLDWERDIPGFARVFGVEVDIDRAPNGQSVPPAQGAGLSMPLIDNARLTTARRGAAYEGFWRTTRPSVLMPGNFFHDKGMLRVEDGLLTMKCGGGGLLFEGWLLPAEGQLFGIMSDTVGLTPIFLALNGTPLPKASVLDGLVMAAALNAARTPSAYPIIIERIGDLTGDREADDARCVELVNCDPRATADSVPEAVRNHLIRDIGPEAANKGGELFLLASMTSTLSRGGTFQGTLTG